jgi:hypothetical protein
MGEVTAGHAEGVALCPLFAVDAECPLERTSPRVSNSPRKRSNLTHLLLTRIRRQGDCHLKYTKRSAGAARCIVQLAPGLSGKGTGLLRTLRSIIEKEPIFTHRVSMSPTILTGSAGLITPRSRMTGMSRRSSAAARPQFRLQRLPRFWPTHTPARD